MRGAAQLETIVRETPWLMEALAAAREVDAPDWLVGGGAVRNAAWDHLHGFTEPTPLADIDLAFFDASDLSPKRELQIEGALAARLPEAPWEARNQAAVHTWFPEKFGVEVEPLTSSPGAIATWPETATAIGLHLGDDDEVTIVAPFGLDDLLGLVNRRNPARVSVEEYERRLVSKRITERWPRVTVIPSFDPSSASGADEVA